MRRAVARMFTFAAALSLLLAAGLAALLVRSYWVEDHIRWDRLDEERLASRVDILSTSKGFLNYTSHRTVYSAPERFAAYKRWNPERPPEWSHSSFPTPDGGSWWRFGEAPTAWQVLGVGHQRLGGRRQSYWSEMRSVVLPPWLVTGSTLVLPALWLWGRWRRRFARRPGLCARCGYDLRASPERCPECGAAAPVGR